MFVFFCVTSVLSALAVALLLTVCPAGGTVGAMAVSVSALLLVASLVFATLARIQYRRLPHAH